MSKVVAVALVLALGIVQVADGFGTGSLLPLKTSGRSVAGCSSLKMSTNPDMNSEKKELNTRRGVVGALFGALLAAPTLIPTEADAASRSGGRVGGGFKSRSAAPRAAPAAAAPAAVSATHTTVIVQPTPVFAGGYGGGMGYGYGGFGMGPPLSPGMWLGLSALELGEAYSREQRRAEAMKRQLETERQLGKDSAQIEALQKQLADQNAQLMQMQQKMNK